MNSPFPAPVAAGLAEEREDVLLLYMAYKEADPVNARAAWRVFYERHYKYVYAVCRSYENTLGLDGIKDLVHDTFLRVFDKAGTFSSDGIQDPEQLQRLVRGWMGTIIKNLFLDSKRDESVVNAEMDGLPDGGHKEAETSRPENPLLNVITQGLETLTDREREILAITFQYHTPGAGAQRLPNNVAAELSERLKTTPENIRQIRKRALDKLKKFAQSKK